MTTLKRYNGTDWEYVGLPSNPAMSPQALGYAEYIGGTLALGAASDTTVTGLQVTVTVPEGRRLKISAQVHARSSVATDVVYTRIRKTGVAGNAHFSYVNELSASPSTPVNTAIVTPAAGTHTYYVTVTRGSGSGSVTVYGAGGEPSWLLVEDITGSTLPYEPASVPVGVIGMATATTNVGSITSAVTLVSCNVVVPAGRLLKVSVQGGPGASDSTTGMFGFIKMDGTDIQRWVRMNANPNDSSGRHISGFVTVSPSAGAHTFSATLERLGGAGVVANEAGAAFPTTILVEDITPTPTPSIGAPSSTLAYAERSTNLAVSAATAVPELTTTITVPAGRRIRISAYGLISNTSTYQNNGLWIKEGGTNIAEAQQANESAGQPVAVAPSVVLTPSAGTHTYTVTLFASAGTFTLLSTPGRPYLLVEDITGVSLPVGVSGLPSSTLAYSPQTANLTGFSADTDLPGSTATITVPAGRRLKITGRVAITSPSVANAEYVVWIREDGVNKQHTVQRNINIGDAMNLHVEYVTTPSAGTHTYKLGVQRTAGTGSANTSIAGDRQGYILVEDITGVGIPGHTHNEFEDTGWVNVSLLNGWVVYDNLYGPSGYSGLATAPLIRRKNGVVYLRGLIRSGTLGTPVFQLPVGYRPSIKLLFSQIGDNNIINRYDVEAGGLVINAGGVSNVWSSLNGIVFIAEN